MRILILLSVLLLNGCVYYVYEQPPAGVSSIKSEKDLLPSKVEVIPQSESLPLEPYPKDISSSSNITEASVSNPAPVMIISDQNDNSLNDTTNNTLNISSTPAVPVSPAGSYNNPIKFKQ